MKRFALLSLTALALVACNPNPAAPSVTGNLDGEWSDLGNVDVAVVGVTEDLATVYDNQFQAVDANFTDGYSVSLPANADQGFYWIVAFVDQNDNGGLDADEVVGNSGSKYLQFSDEDDGNVAAGWNAREGFTGTPTSGLAFADFDLQRTDGGAPDEN